MLTCTGSDTAIFTPQLYSAILNGETTKKVVVDLALPNDVSKEVLQNNLINYIEIESLKKIFEKKLIFTQLIFQEDLLRLRKETQRKIELIKK